MTPMQQYQQEVNELSRKFIRNGMPEAKMLVCDICFDLPNENFTWAWSATKVPSGLEKDFISKYGFEVCKKSDATLLMIIGEQNEQGNWIIGKYKNYWCKPKENN